MDLTNEIEALKKIVDSLTPLDEEARRRVIDYASRVLTIGEANVKKPDAKDPVIPKRSGKPISPQEYLRTYHYKVMTKRIAVMAVYLEREKGSSRFSFKAISDEFKNAKEPKLPAHSQYGRAVAMNFLARDGELYYATSQAEALVDAYKSSAEDQDK